MLIDLMMSCVTHCQKGYYNISVEGKDPFMKENYKGMACLSQHKGWKGTQLVFEKKKKKRGINTKKI